MKKGLYIHIPFCPYKCHYCDFLTFVNADGMVEKYVEYLKREINFYRGKKIEIDSIFIGGGTPSYIDSKYIKDIMLEVYSVFEVDADSEISIEMNPNTISKTKIEDYLEVNINRFSLGVQTFDDEILKILGRGHKRIDIIKDIKMMRGSGVKNISIDMMMGNPKQDMDILKFDVSNALSLNVEHISYYSLILEERTLFEYWLKHGKIELFDDDLEREMYHFVKTKLKENGYQHYETSNFAKEGKKSRHNMKYWNLSPYIGVGLGAASNIGLKRFKNFTKFKNYFDSIDNGKLPIMEVEKLNMEEREKEFIIMNLRMMDGFSIPKINDKFGIDFIEKYKDIIKKHCEFGNVKIENERFMFTERGIDLSNQFYVDII
ncbi:MAG: radical SAM family heme chaperone HemW [Tissierellia bacterium]|nr:radical SAM family heme chaperone HemW [Tissierellia bacterium]